MTLSTHWQAAAAGALVALCVAVLVWRRADLVRAWRASPLVMSAGVTLAAAALWLATLGRRQPPAAPSPPALTPDRDQLPTPPARPVPHEVHHAHDVLPDVPPDPAAPLVVDPDPDLGDLVLRLDARARRRTSSTE